MMFTKEAHLNGDGLATPGLWHLIVKNCSQFILQIDQKMLFIGGKKNKQQQSFFQVHFYHEELGEKKLL